MIDVYNIENLKLSTYLEKVKDLKVYGESEEFEKTFQKLLDEIKLKGYDIDCWIINDNLKLKFNNTKEITSKTIHDIEEITELIFNKVIIEDGNIYFFFIP